MVEKINDIMSIIVAVAALVAYIFSQIRASALKKQVNNLTTTLSKNKENQEKEEQNDMANFLCDKCGRKTPVGDACTIRALGGTENDYSFCPECFAKVSKLEQARIDAGHALQQARQNYERACAALKGEDLRPADSESETTTADALKKLGLDK